MPDRIELNWFLLLIQFSPQSKSSAERNLFPGNRDTILNSTDEPAEFWQSSGSVGRSRMRYGTGNELYLCGQSIQEEARLADKQALIVTWMFAGLRKHRPNGLPLAAVKSFA